MAQILYPNLSIKLATSYQTEKNQKQPAYNYHIKFNSPLDSTKDLFSIIRFLYCYFCNKIETLATHNLLEFRYTKID